MRVHRELNGVYEVYGTKSDRRWWRVERCGDGWIILSGNGNRVVQEDGRLGRSIMTVVEDFVAKRHAEKTS